MEDATTTRRWAGRVLSALAALFLLLDGGMKVLRLQPAIEGSVSLGYPAHTVLPIGLLILAGLALYLVPRTALLGAIWLTGFLGGAVATNVRVEAPLFSHVLFPCYVAAVLWLGLALRNARLRALLLDTAGGGR